MARTIPCTASQIIGKARSQLGTWENPPGSNRQPYSAAMGHGPEEWCADFVAWAFLSCGFDVRSITESFAWTPSFAAGLRAAGWAVVPFGSAVAGDVVFYDWDGHGVIDHVGIVTGRVAGGLLPTIEGNTSASSAGPQKAGGTVATKHRPSSCVSVIVRPPYAHPGPFVLRRRLQLTDPHPRMHGGDVQRLQARVGVTADSWFGPATKAAVIRWQGAHGLTRDGIVGPNTARALGWRFAA